MFDAVDGYHSVKLDEESQPLTAFISEWGRYMYLRLPQGYLAAGDAYTRRFDELISELPHKIKIVDDCLLHDDNIEQSFFHAWDFLTICAKNGIVVSLEKFQFCQNTVDYAGMKITPTGVSPSDKILSAIRDFPTPTSSTDARSWFGLVNQVAWAYSLSPIMEPFRELVKSNNIFHWDNILDKLFEDTKSLIISKVEEGIQAFDVNRQTRLQPDWCQSGIGYLLLQKYCDCSIENAPVCCPDGWRLVYAGSRFTQSAETRYSPTEGEALAVTWALDHAKNFIHGCRNLIVVTDHKPLLGIFNDRDLSSIPNPRISKLKERTFRYQFSTQYCPGKWQRGPDACSRNPSPLHSLICQQPNIDEVNDSVGVEDHVMAVNVNIVTMLNHNVDIALLKDSHFITLEQIRMSGESDQLYHELLKLVETGFPNTKSELDPTLREFWEVRDRLSSNNGLVLMNKRIVIPTSYRKQVLQNLHAAHQGTSGMLARANQMVYWPGMNASVRNYKSSCQTCIKISPSQSQEPLLLAPIAEWPFQQICADFFENEGHSYLTIVDRYSSWLNIYHFPHQTANSNAIITQFRSLFSSYGVSEELSTDGGPQFTSNTFQQFLKDWGVKHRLSSAGYPQSNGRAELAVKSAKRIIQENTVNGTLDNDKTTQAILQYRNTPLLHIGLSPAQILLHRQLRDHVPNHPSNYHLHKQWVISAKQREDLLSVRNDKIISNFNKSAHELAPLKTGQTVTIQNQSCKNYKRWVRTGQIVEVLPFRQYRVKMNGSGRICLRNRRFLKPLQNTNQLRLPISSIPGTGFQSSNSNQCPLGASANTPETPVEQAESALPATPKMPRALKELSDFNKPGLREAPTMVSGRRGRLSNIIRT